jgi:hypothetical protein
MYGGPEIIYMKIVSVKAVRKQDHRNHDKQQRMYSVDVFLIKSSCGL